MLFMVIERFKDRDPIPVCRRVRDAGIKFPEGPSYVGSPRTSIASNATGFSGISLKAR